MVPGLDLLGLAHPRFPFKRLTREIPRETPIGWFWTAFGDSSEEFETLIEDGFQTFRIQCYWSDAHTIVPFDMLRQILKEIKLAAGESMLRLYISPSCEHAEPNKEVVKRRLDLVREVIPWAYPVNNPWKGHGADVPGFLHEYHGSNPGKCDLASTDGDNIYDIDAESWVKKYGNNNHPGFLWGARFNLREVSKGGQQPPPIAQRQATPSVGYLRSILRLTAPKGEAPTPTFIAEKFAAPNIYKTHAEDDQELNENQPDELRENRPVLILQPHVRNVDILTHNGQVIGKLGYYGSFPGGLNRYYAGIPGSCGMYGYEIGDKAKERSNSEFVWFRAGKRTFGPIHPAFRAGVYRS